MIDTRVVMDAGGTILLCETFTDDESKVLKQAETGIVYGQSVVDVIEGYDEETGKPYSRFTYEEVDKPEEPEEPEPPVEPIEEIEEPAEVQE